PARHPPGGVFHVVHMDTVRVVYMPKSSVVLHQAGVVETVSVTSGRMTLIVDGTEHVVQAGQTATFDGGAPHTYRGSGTETCSLIMTVHLPPGPASTT
ncbi:cupin domain-containing protein, partial [Sphaerisporangium sp. NPDC051011]|uniref:cupin domain-containing protein n=1 Tax=Sphaerisporangium sp. NPDC051011 TaxID=3155792 RepID=UPI0033FF026D